MALKIPRRVGIGLLVVLGLAVALGVVFVVKIRPQMQERKAVLAKLERAENNLKRVYTDFGNHTNPRERLADLQKEIESLSAAVTSLRKLNQSTIPNQLFPEDYKSPDKELQLRNTRTYLEEKADEIEERVRDDYSDRRVTLDRAIDWPDQAKDLADAQMRMMNLLVQEDLAEALLSADIFALRKLRAEKPKRRESMWTFTYRVELETSAEGLLKLLYQLRAQDAYYSLDEVRISPLRAGRGDSYFEADERDLTVVATISTYRLQTKEDEAEIDLEARARARQEEEKRAEAKKASDPWQFMMNQLETPDADKEMFGEKKPWWKFW